MMKYFSLCLLAGCLFVSAWAAPSSRKPSDEGPTAGPTASPAANVMTLGAYHPDMNMVIRSIQNNDKELAAYLADPNSVCTFFAPTDKAMGDWMKWFGKYAGKAVQNMTFMHSAFNFHVVPGKALTAADVSKGGKAMTRANETIYFWQQGGEPRVYVREDYPVSFKQGDIKAGKCIVHKINMAMAPPTSLDMVEAWVDEIGLKPPPPPKSQWAPKQSPLPDSNEAKMASAPAAAAEPSPATARPSSSSAAARSTVGMLLLSVGAIATAVLV